MGPEPPSIGIHVVLYRQHAADVERLVDAVATSAKHARTAGRAGPVHLGIGDCSPEPVLDPAAIGRLEVAALEGGLHGFSYEPFGANLGAGGGINRLALERSDDFVLVLHPDTYPSPGLLTRLLGPFDDATVGAADGRQLPLEHPKDYDPETGDTSWVSGSCLLSRGDVFRALGGFDAEHFFLCGGDVDFSWRVRLMGLRTVHEPAAAVFRDRRIEADGSVTASPSEAYHATLAHLLLAHKYGRAPLVTDTVDNLRTRGTDEERAAVSEWQARVAAGAVPEEVEDAASVAFFVDGHYARHRWS